MPSRYELALEALDRRGRLRTLSGRGGLDFTSNDYLGLADSPALKDAVAQALAPLLQLRLLLAGLGCALGLQQPDVILQAL